jgi:hypothetical protein
MPRERGKSKRGVRYYNTLSRRNRLSPSQLALIAHFTSPRHINQRSSEAPPSTPHLLHGFNPVKEEASPSCAHIPPSTPHFLHGLSLVKEEVPPSCVRIPLATSLLPPPQNSIRRTPITEMAAAWWRRKSPRAGRWRKTQWTANEDTTVVASEEKEEEQPQQFANRLTEEHLQLIFEIRQKQDDQMHSQRILDQRMDILFDALADAPVRTRCPTCGQWFTPVYNIHGQPGSQWSKVSRLLFFVHSSCRLNFLVYSSNRLDGHTSFPVHCACSFVHSWS